MTEHDHFLRTAALVGDLANPFYAEERQRDVWNEASAVGFQLALWTTLVASTVALWALGRDAVVPVATALALLGFVSTVTMVYAQRLGVRVTSPERIMRGRTALYLLVVTALVAGLIRATGSATSTLGVAAGAAAAAATWRAASRRGAQD